MGIIESLYHGEVEKAYQFSTSPKDLFNRLEQATLSLYDSENLQYKVKKWEDLRDEEKEKYTNQFKTR